MNFQQILESLMTARDLKQKTIADALGMDTGFLSRILSGKNLHLPEAQTVEKISQFLNCTGAERIELYRLAGRMPAEISAAFLSSATNAETLYRHSLRLLTMSEILNAERNEETI